MNSSSPRLKAGLGLLLALSGVAAAQDTSTVGTPVSNRASLRLPPNYLSRFAGASVLASTYDGFGVRAFPLPFEQDIRFTLAKRPKYWEYNLTTRYQDTTFGIGVFDNGATATEGVPRVEATHDPDKGWQYGLRWQKPPYFTRASVGYAFRTWEDRIRILNNVGYGTEGTGTSAVSHLFTETVASGSASRTLAPNVNGRLNATARLYTFPELMTAEASLDLNPGIHFNPAPNVDIDISHLERFAPQSAPPLGNLNYNRYSESYLSASYRMKGNEQFSIGEVRGNLTRSWTNKATTVGGAVLFRTQLPALVGPSLSYYDSASDKHWNFSLAFGPK